MAYFNSTGRCSLREPPPKFRPTTTISPLGQIPKDFPLKYLMIIGCSLIVINTSLDQLFYHQLQMLLLLLEMLDILLMKVRPFFQQNSVKMTICSFHSLLARQDEYQRML